MFFFRIIKRRVQVKTGRSKNSTYLIHKEVARAVILKQLTHYNGLIKLSYNRVAIRDQRRCWGSCSNKGNLNFSYKLLFLPPCLRDYVIVHELCHLAVLNHSREFWNLVESHMPDYLERRQTLRRLEKTVGTSIRALKKYQAEHTCSSCEQVRVAVEIN